ncbi:MAG: hypothetical protein RLY87_2413 [Chloroflexota bacterium]
MRVARFFARAILLLYALAVLFTECAPNTAVADPTMAAIKARGVLRVGYDPGSLPFTTTRDGQAAGFDIDMATEVARTLGVAIEFVPTGLDAAYDELQQGRFDMIASAMPYAPEQGWRARFSTVYYDDGLVPLSRGAVYDPSVQRTVPIGVVLGSDGDTYLRSLARRGLPTTARTFDTTAQLWEGLQCGVVDRIIIEHSTAAAMQRADTTLIAGTALSYAPYVVVLPYDALYLNDVVNTTLAAMRSDGRMEQIAARWLTIPLPPCPPDA